MRLRADFVKDWHEYIRVILVNDWGFDSFDIENAEGKDLPLIYMNAKIRRVENRKRKIKFSDVFNCPVELNDGWLNLQAEILSGGDINVYQSKGIDKYNGKDPMLNHWGIYHFHLGGGLEGKFIKRTGPLVYALITDDVFYAINVYQHGDWTNADIIETIHRNWSSILEKYAVNQQNISCLLTDLDRKVLRNKNVNSLMQVSDGTVYGLIGGGVVASGHNLKSVTEVARQHKLLKDMQLNLDRNLETLRANLEAQGYQGEEELFAKLEIVGEQYRARFPEYLLVVILQ